MGWYGVDGTWQRRAIISVDNTAAGGTQDVSITIPQDWDDFWERIDTSGNELRVVGGDGSLLVYDVDATGGGAFSKTNRDGRIRIDGWAPGATAAMYAIWLYYGSTSNQGDASQAVTISGAISGYIELGRPAEGYVYQRQSTTTARPRDTTSKTTSEQREIWVNITPALQRRFRPGLRSIAFEEVLFSTIEVLSTAGADQSTMYEKTKTRFVFDQKRGQTWCRYQIKGGSDGTEYTIAPLIRTTKPGTSGEVAQILQPRIGLAVRNVLLPAI